MAHYYSPCRATSPASPPPHVSGVRPGPHPSSWTRVSLIPPPAATGGRAPGLYNYRILRAMRPPTSSDPGPASWRVGRFDAQWMKTSDRLTEC